MQHNYFIAWPRIMKIGQIDVLFAVTKSKMECWVANKDSFKGGPSDHGTKILKNTKKNHI